MPFCIVKGETTHWGVTVPVTPQIITYRYSAAPATVTNKLVLFTLA